MEFTREYPGPKEELRRAHLLTERERDEMIQTMAAPSPHVFYAMKQQEHQQRQQQHQQHQHQPVGSPVMRIAAAVRDPHRSPMLCRYPSKVCDNVRSEKRGGGLHRFCAYHRERANINQRRVDHRRRLRKQGKPVPPIDRSAHQHHQEPLPTVRVPAVKEETKEQEPREAFMSLSDADLMSVEQAAQPLLPDFSEDDLQQLLSVLDDTECIPMLSIKEEDEETADRIKQEHVPSWGS